ncbi:MAG: fructose-6-phosphate aldolase [Pseudomonadales bacterium]|jgi:transaldolase|nr:fructose-6-phosphate aldolase [Pseudomonadales bacterium]
MKFFIDTADIEEIKEAAALGVLDGVTTNPSLVSKTGKTFDEVLGEIIEVVDGPISAEVTATDFEGIREEAKKLAAIHENIVVKIPVIDEGIKAVRWCRDNGIRTNVTLCFNPMQALIAAKAGASYISPFVGRLDDISQDGMELISQVRAIYDNYGYETEVLVASIRHPMHAVQSALMGADVATMPLKVIKGLLKHPLTDIGLEKFLADWEKVPKG